MSRDRGARNPVHQPDLSAFVPPHPHPLLYGRALTQMTGPAFLPSAPSSAPAAGTRPQHPVPPHRPQHDRCAAPIPRRGPAVAPHLELRACLQAAPQDIAVPACACLDLLPSVYANAHPAGCALSSSRPGPPFFCPAPRHSRTSRDCDNPPQPHVLLTIPAHATGTVPCAPLRADAFSTPYPCAVAGLFSRSDGIASRMHPQEPHSHGRWRPSCVVHSIIHPQGDTAAAVRDTAQNRGLTAAEFSRAGKETD